MSSSATPDADGPLEQGRSGGPLLTLVARGLELWLRQRCQAVSELEIQLEGSMADLLRGQLQGVRLQARQVVFQNLSFERVDLRGDAIRVRVAGLLRGQSLRLEHPFRVKGTVLFTGDGLSRSLATPAWRELGDHLCAGLMGVTPFESLRLQGDTLVLLARAAEGVTEVETRMVLTPEGLEVHPVDGRPALPLPMDAAITLERAEVRAGRMELAGEALVRP
ncbi:MAG: DUF2993 domain-containing protein [Cyanobacteriota bacterium]|nr:DUF2993 domain-containing protein [Cyanobacteriota bacterium]